MPERLLIFLEGLALSDFVILFAVTPLAVVFFVSYVAHPGGWWRVKDNGWVGWMTALHSASIVAFLFLIDWAIITGDRVAESVRAPISILLAFALLVKVVILFHERRQGQLERRARKLEQPEGEHA